MNYSCQTSRFTGETLSCVNSWRPAHKTNKFSEVPAGPILYPVHGGSVFVRNVCSLLLGGMGRLTGLVWRLFRRCCYIRNSAETSAILVLTFRSFPQPFHTITRIILQLGHECFLPNSFQFIVKSAFRRCIMTESAVT
jgi:hypothetical protein